MEYEVWKKACIEWTYKRTMQWTIAYDLIKQYYFSFIILNICSFHLMPTRSFSQLDKEFIHNDTSFLEMRLD